ncbi:MAG: hypothetical protein N2Z74_06190, partial [Syntrophales bacterium]|nr:hypothetical protein [Syntrophales bacterium]
MEYEKISALVESMAAEFLCLSGEIDLPSVGGFLNSLEKIIAMTGGEDTGSLRRVGLAMNHLLEQTVMDAVKDKERGFAVFEQGISLLQEIIAACQREGVYEAVRRVEEYEEAIGTLTGYRFMAPEKTTVASSPEEQGDVAPPRDAGMISLAGQDEGLLRDF